MSRISGQFEVGLILNQGGGPSSFREGGDSGVLVGHVLGFILVFDKVCSDYESNNWSG